MALEDNIKEIAKELEGLYDLGYSIVSPTAEKIIKTKSKDIEYIEWHLDQLLNWPTDKCIALFHKLCDYYSEINPKAAKEYLDFYEELYGEEKPKTKEKTLDD